jgi:hypothetical protein
MTTLEQANDKIQELEDAATRSQEDAERLRDEEEDRRKVTDRKLKDSAEKLERYRRDNDRMKERESNLQRDSQNPLHDILTDDEEDSIPHTLAHLNLEDPLPATRKNAALLYQKIATHRKIVNDYQEELAQLGDEHDDKGTLRSGKKKTEDVKTRSRRTYLSNEIDVHGDDKVHLQDLLEKIQAKFAENIKSELVNNQPLPETDGRRSKASSTSRRRSASASTIAAMTAHMEKGKGQHGQSRHQPIEVDEDEPPLSDDETPEVYYQRKKRVARSWNYYKAPPIPFVQDGSQDINVWMDDLRDRMLAMGMTHDEDKVRCLRRNMGTTCRIEINNSLKGAKAKSWPAHKQFAREQYTKDAKLQVNEDRAKWGTRDQLITETPQEYMRLLKMLRLQAFPRDNVTKDDDGGMSERDVQIQERFINGLLTEKLRQEIVDRYLPTADTMHWGLDKLIIHVTAAMVRMKAACAYCSSTDHKTSKCPTQDARPKVDNLNLSEKTIGIYALNVQDEKKPRPCHECQSLEHWANQCPAKTARLEKERATGTSSRRDESGDRNRDQKRYGGYDRNRDRNRNSSNDRSRDKPSYNGGQRREFVEWTEEQLWERVCHLQDRIRKSKNADKNAYRDKEQVEIRKQINKIKATKKATSTKDEDSDTSDTSEEESGN